MTDLSALRALTGGTKPADQAAARASFESLGVDLRTGEASLQRPGLGYQYDVRRDWLELDESRNAVGFGLLDTDAGIAADVGDEVVSIFALDGQLDTIEQATQTDPDWTGLLEERSVRGLDYLHWGDERVGDAEPLRPLGIGGQLAATDSVAILTDAEAAMIAALESHAAGDAIGDAPLFAEALRFLYDAGVYDVFLSPALPHRGSLFAGPEDDYAALTDDEIAERDAALLRPYELFVGGTGFRDGFYEHVGVLFAPDAATANDNAERFPVIVATESSFSGEVFSAQWELIEAAAYGSLTFVRLRSIAPGEVPSLAAGVLLGDRLFGWAQDD